MQVRILFLLFAGLLLGCNSENGFVDDTPRAGAYVEG